MTAIKFDHGVKPTPKGVTSRRLKAASRALERQQQKYPLLSNWIQAQQPTPEQRIERADESLTDLFQRLRNHDAKCWRTGRQKLYALPAMIRKKLIERWNASKCPKTGEYFADFIRSQMKTLSLTIKEIPMLDIFAQYLNTLQTEIADYEEKLQKKKQEAEYLNTLQSQVGQALETLGTVITAIKDVDAQAMTMLKEAALSLFQEAPSEKVTTPVKTTSEEQPETPPQENQGDDGKDRGQPLSERLVYLASSQTALIGLEDKETAKRLAAILKQKNIGRPEIAREGVEINNKWKLMVTNLSEASAQHLVDNLDTYLSQTEKPSSHHKKAPHKTSKGFHRNQRVKVISTRVKELVGKIGQIVSHDNEDNSYVQFDDGSTKSFWKNELQPA